MTGFEIMAVGITALTAYLVGSAIRNYLDARKTAEMMRQMAEVIKHNPSLMEGLPMVYVEKVTESSGQVMMLAYEELSNKFVCQATNAIELAKKLEARWPNDTIYLKTPAGYVALGGIE